MRSFGLFRIPPGATACAAAAGPSRRQLHDPRRVAQGYWSEIQRVVSEKAGADEPMRVVLDFRWMLPGRAGGIENLARSFFRELLAFDRHNRYTTLMPGPVPPRLRPEAPPQRSGR